MIQAPTLLERWAYFYAHSVRGRERAESPSLMRNRYGGRLPRVFGPSGATHVTLQQGRATAFLVPYRQNAPGGPGKGKVTCNMQQLTLQFDGYAPIGRPETLGTAKQCKAVPNSSHAGNSVFPRWEQAVSLLETATQVLTKGSTLRSSLALYAQAALFVCFGFGMVFVAAIIGG